MLGFLDVSPGCRAWRTTVKGPPDCPRVLRFQDEKVHRDRDGGGARPKEIIMKKKKKLSDKVANDSLDSNTEPQAPPVQRDGAERLFIKKL